MGEPMETERSPLRRTVELAVMVGLLTVFLVVSVMRYRPAGSRLGQREAVGVIIAAALTLVMYSFLYRDNPLFKIAENLYVGVGLGYGVIISWRESLRPEIYDPFFGAPTAPALWEAILHRSFPILLGVLLLTRLSRKHAWLSRYTYALMIGWGAGVGIVVFTDTYVLQQLEAAAKPLQEGVSSGAAAFSSAWWGHLGSVAGAAAVLIGTVCVLFYFFFSVRHGKVGQKVSKVGIWFLMVSFGASFGYTVMGRLSLLIGRVRFLMFEWLQIPP